MLGLSTALGLAVVTMGASRTATLSFRSSGLSVAVDSDRGAIAEVTNRLTGDTYPVLSDGCRLTTDRGAVDLRRVPAVLERHGPGGATFSARARGLEVRWAYRLDGGRDYIDRDLSVTNTSDEAVLLRSVEDGALTFDRPFLGMHYHDDSMGRGDPGSEVFSESPEPSLYRCALNVFLRDQRGGLFVGLKYPYWEPALRPDGLTLSYETNYRLQPGETLELMTLFLGGYRKTGTTCRKELHWQPRILVTDQEELDWGEVRAMQRLLRDFLPMEPLPVDGYFLWLNGWWAVLGTPQCAAMQGELTAETAEAYCRLFDRVKQSRCVDAAFAAPVWVGWAGFIAPRPEIDSIGDDAVFPLNPHIERVLGHLKELGLPFESFCEPNSLARHYRADRPDWRVQPGPDPAVRTNQNCHANPEYEEWFYRLICSAIDRCGLIGWSWDHHWVRRPMVCYGDTHGHEPGNCEFQQYRNVTGLIQHLRKRHPQGFLEIYWGLKEAGSWGHRGLSSLENVYENASPCPPDMSRADDQRFQVWYNHNYRFLPTYMNLAQINFDRDANGHRYSVLSALHASTHAQLTEWPEFTTDAEADEVFRELRYWKAWATEHMRYLSDRIDLFGQPCRRDGIDGSAHMIGDRGYLFVFNPWPGDAKWGSVPLDGSIGLSAGRRYSLDEISTGTPRRIGVAPRGAEFAFAVPPKTAMLIEVRPTSEQTSGGRAPEGVAIQPAFRP